MVKVRAGSQAWSSHLCFKVVTSPCTLMVGMWKTVWRLLKKIKMELPYDPAISLLGMYPPKIKTLIQKDTYTPVFIATLFIVAKIWKWHKCPSTDDWIKKLLCIYIYIYNEVLFSHKKNKNFAICNNIDGLGRHYAKWRKSDRERQILYDITYMRNLKNTANYWL